MSKKRLIPLSQAVVDIEIEWLKDNKKNIRRYTYFGDDNHEAIDAQIKVLSKQLTDYEIDDLSWFEDEVESGGALPDDGRWSPHTHHLAMEAFNWMAGESVPPPSEDWKPLVKKT